MFSMEYKMKKSQQINNDYQTLMQGFQPPKVNVEQLTPFVYFKKFSLYDQNIQTISTTSLSD